MGCKDCFSGLDGDYCRDQLPQFPTKHQVIFDDPDSTFIFFA